MKKLKFLFFKYLLFGKNVECNCCGWNGRKFYKTEICPSCKSNGRKRLFNYLFSSNKAGLNILHCSPNNHEFQTILKTNPQNYIRTDHKQSELINYCHDFRESFDLNIKFDLIVLWHVLNCIVEDKLVVENLSKTLKKDGKILALIPIFPTGNQSTFEIQGLSPNLFERFYGHWSCVRACGLDYGVRFESDIIEVSSTLIEEFVESPILYKHGFKGREMLIHISLK